MSDIRTLQSLSFKIIIENLSKYVLKCQTTQDDKFKMNMYFLQRMYSKILLSKLHKKEMLQEFHLDFLLNDHLQEIDLDLILSYSNKDKIIEKLIPISHSFVEICSSNNCDEKSSLDTLMAIIPFAVNVQKIKIPNICDDELLKLIACSCPELTELDIQSSLVTDQSLKALFVGSENSTVGPCKLKYLNLSDTIVSCDDVSILLKNMCTLEELIYDELPTVLHSIYKEIDKNVLFRKYNLTTLDFSLYNDTSLLTLLKVCDELCPFMKNLVVYISKQEVLDSLSNLYSELESITFKDSILFFNETDIDLNDFLLLKGKKLKHLSVINFTLSISVLIENCPKLESLRLTNTSHEIMSKKPTNFLSNLNELKIETFITDPIIELLNASPNVKTLLLFGVDGHDFSDSTLLANLSRFSFNTNLTFLSIVSSDLKVHLAEQILFNCRSLKSLLLDGCKNIGSDDVSRLEEFIKTSKRKIEIFYSNDDESNSGNSDLAFIDNCHGFHNTDSEDDDYYGPEDDDDHYGYKDIDSDDDVDFD